MASKRSRVLIHCDGACSGNPGPGAWAALLETGRHEREIAGFDSDTTNNRMELMAALEALRALKRPCVVEVHSDSQYLIRGMTEWMAGWIARGWVNSSKQAVANRDLWEALQAAAAPHEVSWHWVRGHSGHPKNERVDRIARELIASQRGAGA